MRSLVRIVVQRCSDPPFVVVLQLVDVGARQDLDAGSLRRSCGDATIVLRVDRADRLATVVAATRWSAVVGAAVARCGIADHFIGRGEPFPNPTHGPYFRYWFHRKRFAAWRAGIGRSRDAHDFLRFLVERLELIVSDGPVDANTI